MVLRYTFDKLIKSLDEISNLGLMSIIKGVQAWKMYIFTTKIET